MSANLASEDETCCFNVRHGVTRCVSESGASAPTVLGCEVIWGVPVYKGSPLHMAADLPSASVSTFSHRLP